MTQPNPQFTANAPHMPGINDRTPKPPGDKHAARSRLVRERDEAIQGRDDDRTHYNEALAAAGVKLDRALAQTYEALKQRDEARRESEKTLEALRIERKGANMALAALDRVVSFARRARDNWHITPPNSASCGNQDHFSQPGDMVEDGANC